MNSVVLIAEETVPARPDVVYSLFGARQGVGWVFAADCDVLAVGSAVTLHLPVGGSSGLAAGWCWPASRRRRSGARNDRRGTLRPARDQGLRAGGFRLLESAM